jgi:hypothetical protein
MPDRRRPTAFLAATCAALLGCAGPSRGAGAAAPPAASPERGAGPAPAMTVEAVRLTFAWPADLQAGVRLEHREQRGAETGSARYTHRMVVTPEGRGLRVETRDAEAEGNTPGLEVNVALNEALAQVVTRSGVYVRTEGLDEGVELLGADDDEDRATARAALERISALDWELVAGAWAGRTLRPGEPVAHRFPASVPLLPGVPALLDVELSLVGRVPCEEGEAELRCVELAWRGVPGERARAAALERVRGSQVEGADPAAIEGLRAGLEAHLVAEPDTLLPHRMRVQEELRLSVRQANGDVEEVVDRSDDRYRFTREMEY